MGLAANESGSEESGPPPLEVAEAAAAADRDFL